MTCWSIARPVSAQPVYFLGLERSSGAEECISSEELIVELEELLDVDIRSLNGSDVGVHVHLERADQDEHEGWMATLTVVNGEGVIGSRTLFSEEHGCRALDEMLILSLSLMIDPELQSQGEPGALQNEEPQPTRPIGRVTPARPRQSRQQGAEEAQPWRFGFRLGGLVGVSLPGGYAGGGRAVAAIRAPRFWP